MNQIQKRFLLFIFGCLTSRILITILAKNIDIKYLPILGYIALIPAFGFIYIYLTGSRNTGGEVFGNKIWWNSLRPIHAILYLLFSYNAIYKNKKSWIYLVIDILIGLLSFIFYHYKSNNFKKILS